MDLKFKVFMLLSVLLCQLYHSNGLNIDKRGKYTPSNSGKYVEDHTKWAYKPDNRGKYVHVHIPYNGGYGPFENPYLHDGRDYVHDDKKYTDPFDVQVFTDKTPSIYREYGAPLFNSKYQ